MHELAPGFRECRDPRTGERYLEVPTAGKLLNDFPMFNKGTAFTQEERDTLGLHGLLPPRIVTMQQQIERVLDNYAAKTTDLERYIHLMSLLDRNETLFYRILLDRLEQLLPIVYMPTVGLACQRFGHIYRRNRGLYFTPEDAGRVDEILGNWPFQEIQVVVVTDGQRILGLGDLGAGGMGISIGKGILYAAGAGIHPARILPVCLDVGTDNASLLSDPLYLGKPRPRVRGRKYDDLVEAFIAGVQRRWPSALIQFEDFGIENAFRLLDGHRTRACCFNDDIQGTGAVARAGIRAALKKTDGRWEDQRAFIVGAGSAGIGIARALKGVPLWIFDSKGLLTTDRPEMREFQRPFARTEPGGGLLDTARRVHPTILIGVSGRPGMFTRELIESMAGSHPIVFPLSNPTSKTECTPQQAMEWTNGRAMVATGSPFPGTPQCNNMYVFPGVGLGAVVSGARRITDGMFETAADTLVSMSPEDGLFPPLRDIRRIARRIALSVARNAMASGLVPHADDVDLDAKIAARMWDPQYLPYRPANIDRS
ncbi:MAG: NAD-dependent malic enzyme [Planctomycetes bacterium]|nr:NAD-dependent malic enzyme [Planctomycetota bacterium]